MIIYNKLKLDEYSSSLFQLNYAYSIPEFLPGKLSIGISGGIARDTYNPIYSYGYSGYSPYGYGGYSPYGYDPGDYYNYDTGEVEYEEVDKYLKANIGIFYASDKFDFGLSYTYHIEQENGIENELLAPVDVFSVQGAYRFNVEDNLVFEPNAMIDISKDEIDTSLDLFFEFNERFWAGYSNLNINDLNSFSAGIDIAGRYRVGYDYSFSKPVGDERLKLHEFLLAVKLN